MSSGAELVAAVRSAGGEVQVVGEVLRLRAPRPLPDMLVEALRRHKAEVIELLTGGPPWVACAVCGGRMFWADAREPPDRAHWQCERCQPPPWKLRRHACALPPQTQQC